MHCRHSDLGAIDRGRRTQRGAALIVAMLIFALAASLVVAMRGEFNRFYQRSANLLLDEQVQAYLRAGEELAAMVLIRDYDSDKNAGVWRDDLTEIWNSEKVKQPFPVEDVGWIKGELQDLQGRFNLNTLALQVAEPSPTNRFTAAQEQFIRLLQVLEEPLVSEQEAVMITESISDWLDQNSEPARDGAEDGYYAGLSPSYRAANGLMGSVSELRAVANITPEIYRALEPLVAALPDTGTTLNIHTAPDKVLRSINADGDRSPLSADEAVTLRADDFEGVPDFLDNAVFAAKKDKMDKVAALLGVRSHYFLLDVLAEVADRQVHLYSVLERRDRAVSAIARGNVLP